MQKLIKDHVIVADTYTTVAVAEDGSLALPETDVLVAVSVWQSHRDALLNHAHAVGVQLSENDFVEDIQADLEHFDMIAIEFPVFKDGRGYSKAHALRGRLGFTGELRAIGDVFKDTMFYQQRCGINAFVVKEGRDIEDALRGLKTFTTPYQGTAANPRPLFMSKLSIDEVLGDGKLAA